VSCNDCDSKVTVNVMAYGAGVMAEIICPNCGISYDTNLQGGDSNE
jgi:transcription elongation factor Elf1